MTLSFERSANISDLLSYEPQTDNFRRLDYLDSSVIRQLRPAPIDDSFQINMDTPAQVSQKTIDSYLTSFGNLYKNGACGPETHDAFKALCDVLPDLDEKSVNKAIKEAALNKHVNMDLITQHLMEILQTDGFKRLEYKLGNEGHLKMKNEKSGMQIEVTYKLNKDDREKSTSTVTIKKTEKQ